jgi:uncharacterized protein (DUF2237 family)
LDPAISLALLRFLWPAISRAAVALEDNKMTPDPAINVLGGELETCGTDPVTGFFRDGCCNTNDEDVGSHTVCVQVTTAFLEFSRFRGNDLSTPRPEFSFQGLKEGDRWCLCAARWLEAHEHDRAPRVFLRATHRRALEIVPLDTLKPFALDLN